MNAFRRRAIAAAILTATLGTGAAEAQTKFYARSRLPGASATTPAAPTYTGAWRGGGTDVTETACSSNLKTITTPPYCRDTTTRQQVAESNCDAALKPAATVQSFNCGICGGPNGPANIAYYTDNSTGSGVSTGKSVLATDLTAAVFTTECERYMSTPSPNDADPKAKRPFKVCQAIRSGQYYDIQLRFSNQAIPSSPSSSSNYYASCN